VAFEDFCWGEPVKFFLAAEGADHLPAGGCVLFRADVAYDFVAGQALVVVYGKVPFFHVLAVGGNALPLEAFVAVGPDEEGLDVRVHAESA